MSWIRGCILATPLSYQFFDQGEYTELLSKVKEQGADRHVLYGIDIPGELIEPGNQVTEHLLMLDNPCFQFRELFNVFPDQLFIIDVGHHNELHSKEIGYFVGGTFYGSANL